MAELLPALSQRRARRAFASTPVSTETEALLWRAVSVAPSHGNTQPTRVLIARTSATRTSLIEALSPGNRHWAGAAPLLIVLAAVPEHDAPQPNSDGNVRELCAFNAGIAAGNLMAQATDLGLIAHPMAGFDEVAARAVFGVPPEVRLLAVFAFGCPGTVESLPEDLRARETAAQERLPTQHLVAEDSWTPALDLSAREFRQRQSRS